MWADNLTKPFYLAGLPSLFVPVTSTLVLGPQHKYMYISLYRKRMVPILLLMLVMSVAATKILAAKAGR